MALVFTHMVCGYSNLIIAISIRKYYKVVKACVSLCAHKHTQRESGWNYFKPLDKADYHKQLWLKQLLRDG